MSVEALLGTDRAFAEDLVALRPQPGQTASAANLRALLAALGDRRKPPLRRSRGSRTRTRCAAPRRSAGAARDTLAHAERGRRRRAAIRDRQPDGARRTAGSSRAATSTARRSRLPATSWRSRRRRSGRSPSGAPTACSTRARSHGLPAVPGRGPGRELRDDARPLRAGGDGRREPAARGAGQRRLAADERDAGGPRVDGLGRGAQAPRGDRQPGDGSSRSSCVCAARALDLRAPLRPGPGTAAALAALRERRSRGLGPTASWRPELAAAEELVGSGELLGGGRARRSERCGDRFALRAGPSSPAAAGRRRRRCGC